MMGLVGVKRPSSGGALHVDTSGIRGMPDAMRWDARSRSCRRGSPRCPQVTLTAADARPTRPWTVSSGNLHRCPALGFISRRENGGPKTFGRCRAADSRRSSKSKERSRWCPSSAVTGSLPSSLEGWHACILECTAAADSQVTPAGAAAEDELKTATNRTSTPSLFRDRPSLAGPARGRRRDPPESPADPSGTL